ncbi:MAG: MalY/PatB family protein [Lachnospirales bacterium]
MEYNFDEFVERRGTSSSKWNCGESLISTGITDRFDEDTIALFKADMDIAVPKPIVEAMHKTADERIYGYCEPTTEYFNAIINWFSRRYEWEIKQEEIVYSYGTVKALNAGVLAFTDEGDGVIIQRPIYPPFTNAVLSNNRVMENNQLIYDGNGNYSLNLKEFEELAKKPKTKLFILCNPHNPTGLIFSDAELCEMARICKENDVVIIADEIHGDLIRSYSKFTPIVKLSGYTENIVSCTAINKTFNTAGLQASAIVIQDEKLRNQFKKALGRCVPTPFTINAVIAAYNECEEWLEELNKYFDETFDIVIKFLEDKMPKVKCVKPEGTYLLWLDFKDYGITDEEIRKRIYVNANVLLGQGIHYDKDLGEGFERICLSSPRPMVMEALERIAKAFEDIN